MEPIVALASSPLKSALHIIRISGNNIFKIVSSFFTKKIENIKEKTIFIGSIKNKEHFIDQVVLLAYPNPNSYTGEDLIEIMCHGNILISNEIINLCIEKGMRLATRGEFTSRAYLNKKMDLIQAEAVNDIVNATTIESKTIIVNSLNGETSKLINPIKTKLLDLISNIEVNIDYPEYQDIEEVNKKRIYKDLNEIKNQINSYIKDGEQGIIVKDGLKVAIIGKPNVGKSTLFNALINENKAIVTDIPGTTRDIVEGDINLFGVPLKLLDTAGIRLTDNVVENLGIIKTHEAIKSADIVIYLKENDQEENIKIDNKVIIEVINKADLINHKNVDKLYISALNKDISPLVNMIKEKIGLEDFNVNKPVFANNRQLGLLKKSIIQIDECLNLNENYTGIDLIAVSLNSLLSTILEVLGENYSLDLAKEIFSRFCVGK